MKVHYDCSHWPRYVISIEKDNNLQTGINGSERNIMTGFRRWTDRFLGRLTFLQKFGILFLFGLALPMAVQNVVYYWQTEKNIQEDMLDKIDEALDDKAEKISGTLSGVLSVAHNYYSNELLYRYLDYEYGRDLEFLIQYQDAMRDLFTDSSVYVRQIRNTVIYTDNGTMLNSSYIRKLDKADMEKLGEELTYLNIQPIEPENKVNLRVSHEDFKVQKVYDSRNVSLLCELNYYKQYDKYFKLLRIDIDLASLESILLESNLFDNMLITDTKGRVIAAAREYGNSGEMGIFTSEEKREDGMIVLSRQVEGFPLKLYGIYDPEIISKEFRQSRRLSVGISAGCITFALVCVFSIVSSINRRLHRLVGQSEEIARGNFIRTELSQEGQDEFSILEKSINHMSLRLQELIDREYKEQIFRAELEKETNQAKLLALQEQVNPHFMFNALESIRLRALAKGERETANMIKYMARMFRNLLEWKDNIITLRDEIGFLDEFLHIQNYRFEDEFSYEISVSEEAYECLLPKMMLQPLVENACVHGVEAVSTDRWISVKAWVEAGRLRLEVEDNGGGMSEEKLRELREMLKGEAGAGKSAGLWNVYRRLVLYYGEEFSFEINSVLKKGTVCTITIPAKKQEE